MASVGSRGTPIKNVQAKPPTRVHTLSDGTTRVEKLCPIPINIKMVDADGNVVTVPLANGHQRRNDPNVVAYGNYISAEKLKAGFIPFHECPILTGRVTPVEGDVACREIPKGQSCKHVKAIIKSRRNAKKTKNDKYAARLSSSDEALKKAVQEQTEWMKSMSARLPAAPASQSPFKAKKGDE